MFLQERAQYRRKIESRIASNALHGRLFRNEGTKVNSGKIYLIGLIKLLRSTWTILSQRTYLQAEIFALELLEFL